MLEAARGRTDGGTNGVCVWNQGGSDREAQRSDGGIQKARGWTAAGSGGSAIVLVLAWGITCVQAVAHLPGMHAVER